MLMQNQALLTGRVNIIANNTLNAGLTGTTDTAVLRFAAASGVVPLSEVSFRELLTAAEGLIVEILRPGLIEVSLDVAFTGAVLGAAGIGFNMAAAPIVADPVVGVDGVLKAADIDSNANMTLAISLSTFFIVTSAQVDAGATIRFLATNSAAGAPAGIPVASASYRMAKIARTVF